MYTSTNINTNMNMNSNMNGKLGMASSIINVCAVLAFALCNPFGYLFGCYLSSIFIAFSFVPMICAFAENGDARTKAAGNTAMIFAGMYAVIILLVYFAQLTAVRLETLNAQAASLIDYTKFGLFFNYDLLGYCFMALATFFAGMTISVKDNNHSGAPEQKSSIFHKLFARGRRITFKATKKTGIALKLLLMIHGVFAISCFIIPILGIFNNDMQDAEWIGKAILEFWCLYFIPVGVLSYMYFKTGS